MAQLDPRYRRIDEPVALNQFERDDGKRVAERIGMRWGALKRELINAGIRRLLEELGDQPTARRHDF